MQSPPWSRSITSLFLTILGAGGLIVAKAILDRLGIEAGPPRPPRRQPDAAVFSKAEAIIEQFNLQALKEIAMVEFRSRYGNQVRPAITGAAGGIGAGFACELSARGLDLASTDINLPGVDATAAGIRESTGRTVETIELDMTDRSAVAALDAATAELDIGLVICNHLRGFGHGRFLDGDLEQCHDQLEANVRAYVDLARCWLRPAAPRSGPWRHHLPLVDDRHPGLALRRDVRRVGFKAFVLAFGSAIAYELRNTGVDVLTLVPSSVNTETYQRAEQAPSRVPPRWR